VATELPYWEKDWYWHFKGMRDGIPGVDLDEPLFELRKLSMHPALLDELQNEPRIRVKMARTRLRGVPPERDLLDALLQFADAQDTGSIRDGEGESTSNTCMITQINSCEQKTTHGIRVPHDPQATTSG
jgi:hypothetical protein